MDCRLYRFVGFFLGISLAAQSLFAVENPERMLRGDRFTEVMRRYVAQGLPALILQVSVADDLRWMGIEGYANLETQTPPSADQHTFIASITKTFTSAAILRLAEQGKINLDDTLETVLPGTQIVNSQIVTIRQLLSMTGGLFDPIGELTFAELISDPIQFWKPEILISRMAGRQPIFEPGEKYKYQNMNFILLGVMIEKITGLPAAEVIRDLVFQPLNLNQTFFLYEQKFTGQTMQGYLDQDGDGELEPIFPYDQAIAYTAGGIVTTLDDLTTWVRNLYKGKLLSPSTMQELFGFVATENSSYQYGLGVMRCQYNSSLVKHPFTTLGHDGATTGHLSNAVYIPEIDASIVYLANIDSGQPAAANLSNIIMDIVQIMMEEQSSVEGWEKY